MLRPTNIRTYQVLDVIGRGGMGVVYKAIDPAIGRLVAIKMMTAGFGADPELLKRFHREAQSAGKLQHPNIVTVYELGELDATPYLVMEFIEGESLDKIIHERRQLPLEEKLEFVIQTCSGLQYAHERGIVHRDIKPGNIMVTTNGTVKIVDFGLAHVGADGMTRPGQVMGSINYMSPEQINGQPVDLRTDIFATGVVLYQILTYALPFQGRDTGSTLLKIIHEPPVPLHTHGKDYPPELENVIQRALAKDREARFASADDLAVDLSQILEHLKQDKIESCLLQVQELMAASELEAAQEQLRQVLKLDRQHRRGNELMREVRQRMQKRLAQQQAQELRHKAEEALQRRNLDDALVSLQQAVKVDDSNPELIQFRDSIKEAKARADRIRQALQRAESAQASGELPESLSALEEVLALDPSHAEARAMQAAVSNAIRELERRRQFQELTDRARKQFAAREFQPALDTLQQAGGIDPASSLVKELTRAAMNGLEQERAQREIERLAGEIEDALSRDDYNAALSKTDEGLRQFGRDRRLQQLKTLAEKQREAGEKRAFIAEQIATSRKLLESGKTANALATVEKACRKYPAEPALESLCAMVKETLAREERERQQAEYSQKAKELLRRKQYGEAIQLLESARERLKTADLDDLIQFARDEAASYARRQKLAAATGQANRLLSAEEYERAIEFLQAALAEATEEELQGLLDDAQHRLAEFRRGVTESLQSAQRLIAQKRIHEAVRLLESQPPSLAKSPEFVAGLNNAREELKRIQAISVAKPQVREALAREDFEKAVAIARACRAEVGDAIDLTLLEEEIKVRRTEVFTRRVESAVGDARTLLIGRSYRSALEILDTVSPSLPAVPEELQVQYSSLRSNALAGIARQDSEAERRQPSKAPQKDYAPPMPAQTLPQRQWPIGAAATPVLPPTADPGPAIVEGRQVNIIGVGDSSSLHDRGVGQVIPLGPAEMTEATPPPEQQAHSPAKDTPEILKETQLGQISQSPLQAPELSPTQAVFAAAAAAQRETTINSATLVGIGGWPEDFLRQVEKQLARYIGPVAKIVIKRAASKTTDPQQLYMLLAQGLDRESDRAAFLARRIELKQSLLAGQSLPHALQGAATLSSTPSRGELTSAAIERASALLAPYVGPISIVLAKRAARRADSVRAFYLLLSEYVETKADRERFLRDADVSERE